MNILLWIIQFSVALIFIYSGINKSLFPERKLVERGQTGVEGLPLWLIRFIGGSEILGAFGLILPVLLNIFPILTPISGICLAAIMIPAGIIHYKRMEYKNVMTNIFLFLLSLFITWGRIYVMHHTL